MSTFSVILTWARKANREEGGENIHRTGSFSWYLDHVDQVFPLSNYITFPPLIKQKTKRNRQNTTTNNKTSLLLKRKSTTLLLKLENRVAPRPLVSFPFWEYNIPLRQFCLCASIFKFRTHGFVLSFISRVPASFLLLFLSYFSH